jgi:hypothetical protein
MPDRSSQHRPALARSFDERITQVSLFETFSQKCHFFVHFFSEVSLFETFSESLTPPWDEFRVHGPSGFINFQNIGRILLEMADLMQSPRIKGRRFMNFRVTRHCRESLIFHMPAEVF